MSFYKKQSGNIGEALSVNFFLKKGYKILEKNFSCKLGEIDLIVEDICGTIIFVEVKLRLSTAFGFPREAITKDKIKHLKNTAAVYLKSKKLLDKVSTRFDCIEIIGSKEDYTLEHLEDIF